MSRTEIKDSLESFREFCTTAIALCDLLFDESVPPRVKQYRKKLYAQKLDEIIEALHAKSKETST